jgi:hypothetical protein
MLSASSRIQKQFRNLLETAGILFKEKNHYGIVTVRFS